MKKEAYAVAELEVVAFDAEDVITTSGGENIDETVTQEFD